MKYLNAHNSQHMSICSTVNQTCDDFVKMFLSKLLLDLKLDIQGVGRGGGIILFK